MTTGQTHSIELLWNTSSGWMDSEAKRERICSILASNGSEVHVTQLEHGADIGKTIKSIVDGGANAVIAAGGDGTVNATASALLHRDIALGIIPAGTLNHLARDLNLPLDEVEAARALASAPVISIDAAAVNGHVFVNNSVLGFFPHYRKLREKLEERWLGSSKAGRFLAVVLGLGVTLWRLPRLTVSYTANGRKRTLRTPFVLVGNNEHRMHGFALGTREVLTSGLLWVYVMRPYTRWELFKRLTGVLLRRVPRESLFEIFPAAHVTVECKLHKLGVGVDGEVVDLTTPLHYESLPSALRVLAPNAGHRFPLMRSIVHISDLHFGYNDPLLAKKLCETIHDIRPDLLVISGDLVEHATVEEFESAREFLQQLPKPQIVVPGNHDLPFYNLWRRWTEGLKIYGQFITDDLEPIFVDDEIAVIGADSAHLFPVKGGRITPAQLDALFDKFSKFPSSLIRILVTHHPFDLPEPSNPHLLIGHSRRAVTRLAPVVDLLLAGHVHLSSTGSTSTRYKLEGHAMVFVQAGTAISDRNKGEANSFNLLHVGRTATGEKQAEISRYSWCKANERFERGERNDYRLGKTGWSAWTDPAENTNALKPD